MVCHWWSGVFAQLVHDVVEWQSHREVLVHVLMVGFHRCPRWHCLQAEQWQVDLFHASHPDVLACNHVSHGLVGLRVAQLLRTGKLGVPQQPRDLQ